jgi:phosphinothricin acetyltransferase
MDTTSSPANLSIRDAVPADLPAILDIFNDVILTTTAVYSEQPVTLENRRAWFEERRARGYPVLTACMGETVAGFGSFGDFRPWPCYGPSVEHSVHVRADFRSHGIGRELVKALVARAEALGKHTIIAGVDSENVASFRLHQRLGFTEAAHLREVGLKFGRRLDLKLLQKMLSPSTPG